MSDPTNHWQESNERIIRLTYKKKQRYIFCHDHSTKGTDEVVHSNKNNDNEKVIMIILKDEWGLFDHYHMGRLQNQQSKNKHRITVLMLILQSKHIMTAKFRLKRCITYHISPIPKLIHHWFRFVLHSGNCIKKNKSKQTNKTELLQMKETLEQSKYIASEVANTVISLDYIFIKDL